MDAKEKSANLIREYDAVQSGREEVKNMPWRSMEDTLETLLDIHETWTLEYSYGSPGPNLGISSIACNSFEECQEQLQYLLLHTSPPPLWARAIHTREKTTVETTTHELMIRT